MSTTTETTEPCQHPYTRPATRDDQRPYCVNCLTIVAD